MKINKLQTFIDIVIILVCGVLSAVALHTFVNPANFASSGVEGIAVMLQHVTGINMGYFSLAINLPLLIVAWFFISKKYVIYTALYTVASSVMLIVMENMQVYQYVSDNNTWIAVFASGIILGIRTALMIRIGGSSGGVDIVASMIQKKRPYINIETLITAFCYFTIAISFFVYWNIESVLMSVVQMLIFNLAMGYVLKSSRTAVEVKIITPAPEAFRDEITMNLKHGATIVRCEGMYTGEGKHMIITIININQMNDLIKLAKRHKDSFIYIGDVSGVQGNFRWHKTDAVK